MYAISSDENATMLIESHFSKSTFAIGGSFE